MLLGSPLFLQIFSTYLLIKTTNLAKLMISENHSYGGGQWTTDIKKKYNLADAVPRHTVQVNENSFFTKNPKYITLARLDSFI